MRTRILTALGICVVAFDLPAEMTRHIDVKNLFPNVGTAVLVVDPNNAGIPSGVLPAGSGVLIGEQVFLTAAHVTRPSEDGIPPFIHLFVTFNLHALDDRSSWIPVVAQAWRCQGDSGGSVFLGPPRESGKRRFVTGVVSVF